MLLITSSKSLTFVVNLIPFIMSALLHRCLPGFSCNSTSRRAQAISPPASGDEQYEYSCYALFQHSIYQVFWNGLCILAYPDMAEFPKINNGRAGKVEISKEMAKTIRHCYLVGYGTDSFIVGFRWTRSVVVELAHPNLLARQRLRYEYDMLRKLSTQSLQVPKVQETPIFDAEGRYGYQMERLYALDINDIKTYALQVNLAMQSWHNKGFSHGDLHPSNVMLDRGRRIVIIDASHAGCIGDDIPPHIPSDAYRSSTFHPNVDRENLGRYFL